MASASDIALVVLNLPSWRADLTDWNDAKVGTVLDQLNGNVTRTVRQFWIQRVGDTSPLTDVTETGSTVEQSQSYEHAVAMLEYWDKQLQGGNKTTFGKIKKRYEKPTGIVIPLDPYGYGGVYARTD